MPKQLDEAIIGGNKLKKIRKCVYEEATEGEDWISFRIKPIFKREVINTFRGKLNVAQVLRDTLARMLKDGNANFIYKK